MGTTDRETPGNYLKAMPKLLKQAEQINLNQLKQKLGTAGEKTTVWRDNSVTIMNWSTMLGKENRRKSIKPQILVSAHENEKRTPISVLYQSKIPLFDLMTLTHLGCLVLIVSFSLHQ